MEKERKGFLSMENAKNLVKLLGIDIFEDSNSCVEYETDELKNKIEAYVKAKKELKDLLEEK